MPSLAAVLVAAVLLGNTSHDVQRVRCLTHQCSDTETQLPVQCEDGRWYGSRCAAGCSGQTRCAAQDLPHDTPPEVMAAVASGTHFTQEEHDALTRTNQMLMEQSGAPGSTQDDLGLENAALMGREMDRLVPSPAPHVIKRDCEVSPWSGWTPCTKLCGWGQRARARMIVLEAVAGGERCPPLIENSPCNTVPCKQALPPAVGTAAASEVVTGADDEQRATVGQSVVMEDVSTILQEGAFPYLFGGGARNMQPSVEACKQLCLHTEECRYGTYVTDTMKLKSAVHSYDSYTRQGECWLSATTHDGSPKCGVPCASFRKVRSVPTALSPPTLPPSSPPPPSPPPSPPCVCSPAQHTSSYTVCRQDPFNGRVHVLHLAPRFHTQIYATGARHRCRVLASKKCSCCDCVDSMRIQLRDMQSLGFGVHTATFPFVREGTDNVQPSLEACEAQCHALTNCIAGTWISGGDTKGQCWLSSAVEKASKCKMPCMSFVRVTTHNDDVNARHKALVDSVLNRKFQVAAADRQQKDDLYSYAGIIG